MKNELFLLSIIFFASFGLAQDYSVDYVTNLILEKCENETIDITNLIDLNLFFALTN